MTAKVVWNRQNIMKRCRVEEEELQSMKETMLYKKNHFNWNNISGCCFVYIEKRDLKYLFYRTTSVISQRMLKIEETVS